MTPADLARQNAIAFECKKDGLRQTQAGTWKVTFTVLDMDERLTKAFPGTRYQAVLVEIDDSEMPVSPKEKIATPQPAEPDRHSAGAKRDWRDVPPTEQAGIHCNDAVFIAFLKEHRTYDWNEARDAAECVRMICGIESRKLLNTDHRARMIWHGLDSQFQAWKIGERIGA